MLPVTIKPSGPIARGDPPVNVPLMKTSFSNLTLPVTVRPFEAVICPVAVIMSPTALPKVTLLLKSVLASTFNFVAALISTVGAVMSKVKPALISK